jgi:putative transposase
MTKTTFGAYEFRCYANKGKVQKILEVLREYRKTAQKIASFPWKEFLDLAVSHISVSSLHHIQSNLSERYMLGSLCSVGRLYC